MASSSKPEPGVTVLNLASLSIQQLDQLKSSVEEVNFDSDILFILYLQDVGLLTTSMAQLKIVQQKYLESKSAINYTAPASEGTLYFGDFLINFSYV